MPKIPKKKVTTSRTKRSTKKSPVHPHHLKGNTEPVKTSKKTAKKTVTTSRPKASEDSKPERTRKVIYPELRGEVDWLLAEQARTFLGWKQSTSDKPYTTFLFKDRYGVPTKCLNVEKQRPFYYPLALQWMHEILNIHWNGDGGETNGESMIIGRTGIVIDGKHRLVGLALAEQEYLKNPDKYPWLKEAPKIHCFINIGVREDMVSINTINTGKPRSLADAIYASGLFGDLTTTRTKDKRDVKMLSRMADYAVRLLWHRTGAKREAFAPKRTHSESLDFIQRHPKLLECLRHIHEENGGGENRLKFYPSPGMAAGLLYLMGSSKTVRTDDEGTGYMDVDCPTEDLLDWSMFGKACDFWTMLAARAKEFDPVREVIGNLLDSEGGSFTQERIAVLVKAWWRFSEDMEIIDKSLELETQANDDGIQRLIECPTVGEMIDDVSSIDLGNPKVE